MKHTLNLALFGIFSLILFSCSDDENEVIQTKKTRLTFSIAARSDGELSSSDIPDGAALTMTYTKNNGTPETKTISLLKTDDQITTNAIEFTPGRYTIDDFMIVQGSDIVYATPKRGSVLASIMDSPVDYHFVVADENAIHLKMDVINVAMKQPRDFGYKSFKVKSVKPLHIAVSTGGEKKSFTDAEAQIIKDGIVISSHLLKAKMNSIPFDGDVDSVYSLVVSKDGFATFTQEFTYSAIKGKPWEILLNPALKMHIRATYVEETPFEFLLDGTGTIHVSGAGVYSGNRSLPWQFDNFDLDGQYDIEITGDIGNITNITSFGYNAGIEQLSGLQHLSELTVFSPGWRFNHVVDLTYNTKLETVDLGFAVLPEFVKLPNEHNISFLSLFQWYTPNTTEQIDYIVNNLYENATIRNIRDGALFMNNNEAQSDNTRIKAAALESELGWWVEIEEPYE